MEALDVGAKFLGTRWAARAPIALFKARLGFLFAGRLLLLLHRGRNSGAERSVVLEAVDREDPDTVLVASGFGTAAQWYKNLKAEPACLVSIGFRHRVPATADLLDPSTSSSLLARYEAHHPRLWNHLSRSITTLTGHEKLDIPMVRLHLERRPDRTRSTGSSPLRRSGGALATVKVGASRTASVTPTPDAAVGQP